MGVEGHGKAPAGKCVSVGLGRWPGWDFCCLIMNWICENLDNSPFFEGLPQTIQFSEDWGVRISCWRAFCDQFIRDPQYSWVIMKSSPEWIYVMCSASAVVIRVRNAPVRTVPGGSWVCARWTPAWCQDFTECAQQQRVAVFWWDMPVAGCSVGSSGSTISVHSPCPSVGWFQIVTYLIYPAERERSFKLFIPAGDVGCCKLFSEKLEVRK